MTAGKGKEAWVRVQKSLSIPDRLTNQAGHPTRSTPVLHSPACKKKICIDKCAVIKVQQLIGVLIWEIRELVGIILYPFFRQYH